VVLAGRARGDACLVAGSTAAVDRWFVDRTLRPWLRRSHYLTRHDLLGMRSLLGGLFENPLADQLALLNLPTLVVTGELDAVVPAEQARRAVAAIPGARLAVIRGAMHNPMDERPREFERVLLEFLEKAWTEPDNGIWEMRGPRQHFVHSKVMAWVAFDRAVKAVDLFGLEGPRNHWADLRNRIHGEVCERGFDRSRGVFVQHYEGSNLDASLLMLPLVGFLPAEDPRMLATVAAIERELTTSEGLVLRYRSDLVEDGLPPGEGVFLPCSFWLVDNLAMVGRINEARALFERLLDLRNDVGLLSEEYDPQTQHQMGNFPQAFTHVALINSARNLTRSGGPSDHRARDTHHPGAPV
jgi:hypothetical protein